MNSQLMQLILLILQQFHLKNPIDPEKICNTAVEKINIDWPMGLLNANININALGFSLKTLTKNKINILESSLNIDDKELVKRRLFKEGIIYQKQSSCPSIIVREGNCKNKFYVITDLPIINSEPIFKITSNLRDYLHLTKAELLEKFQKAEDDYTSLNCYNFIHN